MCRWRLRWEKELSAGRWLGLTWPPEYGGRGATLAPAIIFEYIYAASVQHQRLLELATELLAEDMTVTGDGYALGALQRAFLLPRAETIYGGSSQIQRNIIGERTLGLPK